MTAFRSSLHGVSDEISIWWMWFVHSAPGRLGRRLRTRAYRRRLRHLGADTVLQPGLFINSPELVSIGAHCNFAQRTSITGGGGVDIGDRVGFGPDTKVWSVNHRFVDPETPWLLQGWIKKRVVIEDDVWLGANVFVMPGVRIGKGAIVSAGTVVSKSVPPYSILAGNPGRVIGWRKRPLAMVPVEGAGSNGTDQAEEVTVVQPDSG